MLSIRLQRTGRRNEPTFRIVVTDSKNGPKSGKSLEVIGSFDSRRAEKAQIDTDRVKHWMSNGAKLSGTIHNLLVSRKIIEGKKINVLPKKRPIKKEAEASKESKEAKEATPATEPAASSEAASTAEAAAAPEPTPVA